MQPLLSVDNLKVLFYTREGVSRVINDISFELESNKTLGIVGESGCGKSITALAIMRLMPEIPKKVEGKIFLENRELLRLSRPEMRKIRGNRISMIFQEPMTSLNPVFTIGNQISEAIRLHQGLGKKEVIHKAIDILKRVGIPSPENRIHDYPHQLSGGMRQRVMIAMALACNPKLLIADEPTTALDVTIQAQILELMTKLQEELGMAIIFISHDLGVIAEVASKILVFYAGQIVEQAEGREIFENPQHPYTKGLIESLITIDQGIDRKGGRLPEIAGVVPTPYNLPQGCKFSPRCPFVRGICKREEPSLNEVRPGYYSACWLSA